MNNNIVVHQMGSTNYFEYYFFVQKDSEEAFQTDIGEDNFKNVIAKLASKNWKYFQRDYKEYHYNDVVYQNPGKNEEVKVYRNINTQADYDSHKHILTLGFQRQKLSLVNVPSNKNYSSIVYVKQLIFRITSRIYVNAIVKKDENNNVFYEIFMNYNHDANVDKEVIDKQKQDIQDMIASYLT